jgi:hypothetical protein
MTTYGIAPALFKPTSMGLSIATAVYVRLRLDRNRRLPYQQPYILMPLRQARL